MLLEPNPRFLKAMIVKITHVYRISLLIVITHRLLRSINLNDFILLIRFYTCFFLYTHT